MVKARTLSLLTLSAKSWYVRNLLYRDLSTLDNATIAESLHAIGPHAVLNIGTCGHIALELPNSVFLIGRLHCRSLALNDYVCIFLLMLGLGRQDNEISPRFAGTNPQRELNLDIGLGVAVLAHK